MSFVPGLELSRRFYRAVVAPVLAARFPGLRHSAARMDTGSELLGFDTARSRDHDWGPRVQIFLDRVDPSTIGAVTTAVTAELPATFLGRPTRFAPDARRSLGVPDRNGTRHGITVVEVGAHCRHALGFDPRAGVGDLDWLATPTQRLAEFTGGAVFHDGLPDGGLRAVRSRLAWYPDDLWRHVLAGQWSRVAGEEPFVGRCAEVGDDLGAAVVSARLIRDLMRLSLLVARRYPPYGKWLGSAFRRLPDTDGLPAVLRAAAHAADWPTRQEHLCRAYELVAARTNALGLAEPVEPTVRPFQDRPFLVLDADRLVGALRRAITDARVRRLPAIGAVDQFLDHPGLLTDVHRVRAMVAAGLEVTDHDRRP
ncbi:DUF4037 domain-containing protein [Solwaraspora sp. WMMD406]|uniref:DUF4037 domain-containing protein n=1 Tax=Solwaraspora sp. WMMD406 TaxID=3016095 RepID=UPI00241780B9|nr:DUF4037 domain-containing protein [Solwaraspora sp. WMMD406]MDG4766210.1 DUF4037 domain-containing protein [Solwaraspora sp. WMMD406]